MSNDRRRVELMNALLFTMPGTPIVYYGDEIGMGDNIYLGDHAGVRTPMQWSGDRNAGFSRGDPQALYAPLIVDPEYHYAFTHVDAQPANRSSLLWFMRRVIAVRKRHPAFLTSSGTTTSTWLAAVLKLVRHDATLSVERRAHLRSGLCRSRSHAGCSLRSPRPQARRMTCRALHPTSLKNVYLRHVIGPLTG